VPALSRNRTGVNDMAKKKSKKKGGKKKKKK
jgi:hypothetical protein